MNDILKNPIALFFAGLLALWLAFKLLSIFVSFFWLVLIVFAVLFVVNPKFRNILRGLFKMFIK
jgi:hypothetical protein